MSKKIFEKGPKFVRLSQPENDFSDSKLMNEIKTSLNKLIKENKEISAVIPNYSPEKGTTGYLFLYDERSEEVAENSFRYHAEEIDCSVYFRKPISQNIKLKTIEQADQVYDEALKNKWFVEKWNNTDSKEFAMIVTNSEESIRYYFPYNVLADLVSKV